MKHRMPCGVRECAFRPRGIGPLAGLAIVEAGRAPDPPA